MIDLDYCLLPLLLPAFACSSFRGYRWVDVCKELRILAPDPAEPVGGKQILVESKLRVVQVGNRRY